MIKAVLLDLFGTVVGYGDVLEGTRLAWEGIYAVLQSLGTTVPYERFAPDWQTQLTTPVAPEEEMAETPFLDKMLRLFRSHGLPPDAAAAKIAADRCLAGWDAHITLPEDTIPTLRALRKNYAVALVSNFDHPPYVHDLLSRHRLAGLFDHVTISGDIRIDKPDPRIFQVTLAALGCRPQEAVFVGDSLRVDVDGARAVGCRPVLIDMKGRHGGYTGEKIQSLSELLALLDGWRDASQG